MQTVSRPYLEALSGSSRPVVRADAWYDGRLVLEDLPIIGGSAVHDGGRLIPGSLTLVAASPDDTLAPTGWDAPLAPYGSELHVRAGLQTGTGTTELLSLGRFRIDTSDPDEWWTTYPGPAASGPPLWVCRGVRVTVQASDRMALVDDYAFLQPESPADLASVVAEIRRLARDVVPIADLSDITDAAIPANITYQTSRVRAIQDLADVLGMVARMTPDGALGLVPKDPSGAPVWTVDVGRGDGTIVSWGRRLDRTGLHNAVVSSGTTPEGVAVQGVSVEGAGPLRWGGPFGRVVLGHSSPLITTDEAAVADSFTRLTRSIRNRVVPITVRCAPNYAIQLDDVVGITLPDADLSGPVASITWPLPLGEMVMVVMVPRAQLWTG